MPFVVGVFTLKIEVCLACQMESISTKQRLHTQAMFEKYPAPIGHLSPNHSTAIGHHISSTIDDIGKILDGDV